MKYLQEESSTLELKQEVPKNEQIIKTLIGFSNQNGGKLVIGVSKDGTIVGVPEKDISEMQEYLHKAVYEASAPPIIPLIYTQTIGDKTVLMIEVSSGTNKPYYRKSEGLDQGTYVRLGRSTLKANADLIEELKWQSRGKSFDMMPVYQSSEADLDLAKIKQFLASRKQGGVEEVTQRLLSSYYLVVQEHSVQYATNAGLLLFGKHPQHFLSEAFIICSHFKGTEGRESIASIDCTGTLFEQFETAFHFIASRLSHSFKIEGPRRTELLEIPPEAIREALLNAIVHRNYHLNSSIKIAIYDNRIEFFSPGTIPGPIDLQNLQSGLSFIRNVAICKVFREAGYIEKLGSGFPTILNSYEKRGLKTPLLMETEAFVKCILPREKSSSFSDELEPILRLFESAAEITISDVMRVFNISRATAGRKLNQLVEKKQLQKVGSGRAVRYIRVG
ncbi:MAG: putative DNA binding domain-containing protein [Chlamydiales bacterium]|nr:putative DNA binding domain-containing protein [Chlamydiales bacterium]